MDAIDREIIGVLSLDGRISATDLADRVNMSVSATSERLRRLRESGVILGFSVQVDPHAVGRPIEALVDVRLGQHVDTQTIDDALARLPLVVDAVHLTGRFDTQLRIAAANVRELDALLETLKAELGVEETNTRLVLRTVESFPRPAALLSAVES